MQRIKLLLLLFYADLLAVIINSFDFGLILAISKRKIANITWTLEDSYVIRFASVTVYFGEYFVWDDAHCPMHLFGQVSLCFYRIISA